MHCCQLFIVSLLSMSTALAFRPVRRQTDNSTTTYVPATMCVGVVDSDSCDGKGMWCCSTPTQCTKNEDASEQDIKPWECANGNEMACGTGETLCGAGMDAMCCQDGETCNINTGDCVMSEVESMVSSSYSVYSTSVDASSTSAMLASETAANAAASSTATSTGSAGLSRRVSDGAVVLVAAVPFFLL